MSKIWRKTPSGPQSASLAGFMAATGGTGIHTRLSLRTADGPDYVGGSEVRQCVHCFEDVWYDPQASIYPDGEVITCVQCYAKARGVKLPNENP